MTKDEGLNNRYFLEDKIVGDIFVVKFRLSNLKKSCHSILYGKWRLKNREGRRTKDEFALKRRKDRQTDRQTEREIFR